MKHLAASFDRPRPLRALISCAMFAAGLTFVAAAPPARAQDTASDVEADESDEEGRAAAHFASGRSLYAKGKYKEAITELLEAFKLRPAPPILLNIGRTYEKLDEKVKALDYYRQFLQKARLVDPNRKAVESLVKQLEQETGAQATDAAAATETPDAARTTPATGQPPASRTEQVIHTPVDSAKVREPITIQAELPPHVRADVVRVHYRQAGELDFRHLPMASQGDAFIARIPGEHVTSSSLQYYIEATRRGQRRPVALAGGRSTPHIVVIEGGRAPRVGGGQVDISSPYRAWFWVGAAGTLALFGGSIAMAVLASDRASAVEVAGENAAAGRPEPFDGRARAWESEGQTFAALGKVLLGVGVAAAGATGYLWYRDRKYVQARRQDLADVKSLRFSGAPWASAGSAGFVGQIDF